MSHKPAAILSDESEAVAEARMAGSAVLEAEEAHGRGGQRRGGLRPEVRRLRALRGRRRQRRRGGSWR